MAEGDIRVESETAGKQILSKDQLILPEKQIPQEVLDVLQRAEKAGIRTFEPYHLSGITLTEDSKVKGWDKKPRGAYWEEIREGNLSKDSSKLPNAWVLVDKTKRPDYYDGQQLHDKDPFGPLLKKLREENKIKYEFNNACKKPVPDTSRFAISQIELREYVFPEIAKMLEVNESQVRLPRAIEFNVIGNFSHPEWGKPFTREWLDDDYRIEGVNPGCIRLVGGMRTNNNINGLVNVDIGHSHSLHNDEIAFRPLVVIPVKA